MTGWAEGPYHARDITVHSNMGPGVRVTLNLRRVGNAHIHNLKLLKIFPGIGLGASYPRSSGGNASFRLGTASSGSCPVNRRIAGGRG